MNSLPDISSMVSAVSQIYSHRELEDQLNKIREMLSDDKHDWEHRVVAVSVLPPVVVGGGVSRRGSSDGLCCVLVPWCS